MYTEIDKLQHQIEILQDRCELYTKGLLCYSCEFKDCKHRNTYFSEGGGTYFREIKEEAKNMKNWFINKI